MTNRQIDKAENYFLSLWGRGSFSIPHPTFSQADFAPNESALNKTFWKQQRKKSRLFEPPNPRLTAREAQDSLHSRLQMIDARG
jgi:hypothetical protein